MINFRKSKQGLTLVELLVAVSLFSAVGLMVVTLFINVTSIQARLSLENAINEDARFMMERISRAVRNNAVDYEEYFNKAMEPDNQYGDLYGCYSAQFFNPGLGEAGNEASTPGVHGAFCYNNSMAFVAYTGQDNCVVYKPSVDINTGQLPYKGAPGTLRASNAFTPSYLKGVASVPKQLNQVKELYLIDKTGQRKTIFSRKSTNGGAYALSLLELNGKDENNDGVHEKWRECNGSPGTFCCESSYDCTSGLGISWNTLEDTLNLTTSSGDYYSGFVPISPMRTNITNINFQISPGDDPRKAFASNNITQPMVRISLTVQPSPDQLTRYGNPSGADIPTLTLQTTVSSRIQSEVKSYLGSGTENIGDYTPPPASGLHLSNSNYCGTFSTT
jgi:type II secretory pathway pseudopilin PulG